MMLIPVSDGFLQRSPFPSIFGVFIYSLLKKNLCNLVIAFRTRLLINARKQIKAITTKVSSTHVIFTVSERRRYHRKCCSSIIVGLILIGTLPQKILDNVDVSSFRGKSKSCKSIVPLL